MLKKDIDLKTDFDLLRTASGGEERINQKIEKFLSKNGDNYTRPWYKLSREEPYSYPSQGLLKTSFDYLDYGGIHMLPHEVLMETLKVRIFFLELFNHPYRIQFLKEVSNNKYIPPKKNESQIFKQAEKKGMGVSIGDLGVNILGSEKERSSRTLRYAQGPFVKLGKYARIPFVGSASPDVWNSSAAISTMAASHGLSCIPRNGVLSDLTRQADLAVDVFKWLKDISDLILIDRSDKEELLTTWKRNVVGTLEAEPDKSLRRAEVLYKTGVRTFRVYSPEPGIGAVQTVKALRKEYKDKIEIFVGQMVDVAQCRNAEEAGADGLYVGIGGGGRCITGVRSGSVIDWPTLVWNLRGAVSIPIIAEGGASDHVSVALSLGVTGIGVTRVAGGGTIESPGGALYFIDSNGKMFKPYGGEASARTKFLDGKMLPFNVPSFIEGETTKAYMSYVTHVMPTLTYNLHLLIEDAILAMVFRNVENISELQNIDPSPLRLASSFDVAQRGTH